MTSHLIIAGTEKAGTSSVYQYLAAHPGVVASTRKETDYFRFHTGPLSEYELNFPAAEGSDGKPPRTICKLPERGVCCNLLRTPADDNCVPRSRYRPQNLALFVTAG